MKTTYLDFVWSTIAISAILAAAVGVTVLILPFSRAIMGDYHVLVDAFLVLFFYGLFSGIFLRLVLRWHPIRTGSYTMESPVFTYWKLLSVVYRLGQAALTPFTPVFLKPVVESLFGARVGTGVALGGTIDDPYMVTIGDGAILGHASLVSGNMIHGGKLTCGPITIGAGATVGVHSVLLPGTEIGENVTLMAGSYVLPNTKIPAGETWRGNPARKWL